ncbi:uncharacterized protein P884DRAFT_256906 [Thermothelomyces heterothallicus CBS 202.75]|uniref:uncharacterized protein n=1 Tax=Thermothelomyces heterothallicus CBS 202.75 TaxID=1149848 RepID=UPI0037431655
MSLLEAREALSFPPGNSGNLTDTVIDNVHFNLTTLEHWNYTYFSNGTLSNGSWCFLTFPPYTPAYVFPNGTFLNATKCWSPTESIRERGGVAIGYAVLFGITLVLTLVNLHKHGRLHLPAEKRFYPIGRRWQWYWASFVCATAMVSLFVSIDVDRYYLPELPVILTTFFWYLMQMGTVALVWEAVRHWGSWMERQFIDPDPFTLRQDDRRARVELYLPLLFYLFLWLNFFMIVPRNWSAIQHQRSPEQTLLEAAPSATDSRFRAGAFMLVGCWLVTVFSLRHSIKYYCPQNRGIFNRIIGFVRYTPLRLALIIPLAAALVAYQILVAFRFEYGPVKVGGNDAAIFVGGYTPSFLILVVQIVFGLINPNEDRELQRQRRERNQVLNREMGIVPKPSWWRRVNGEYMDPNEGMRERLMRNVREVHGTKPAASATVSGADAQHEGLGVPLEMTPMSSPPLASPRVTRPLMQPYTGKSERRREERTAEHAAGLPYPVAAQNSAATAARRREELMKDGPPPSYTETVRGAQFTPNSAPNVTRNLTGQSSLGSTNQPPQQIRSMLDV